MTKTSFSGPVESIVGGFVAENGGSFITDGGDFKAINGGRFVSDGVGFIETLTDPSGVTREVSGVQLDGAALPGENAGIVGTARSYSTILNRSAPSVGAVGIASVYIEITNLSLGITQTENTWPIGREWRSGVPFPAYILQVLTGSGTQIENPIGGSLTCLIPPTGAYPLNLAGLTRSTSGVGTQNQALPGTVSVLIAAQSWTAGETKYIGPLSNNQYLYLTQGVSTVEAQYPSGLFRLDLYSIDA